VIANVLLRLLPDRVEATPSESSHRQKEVIIEWGSRPLKLPSGNKGIAILHPSYLMTYKKDMRENTLNDRLHKLAPSIRHFQGQ
jgi:hypothetical protein